MQDSGESRQRLMSTRSPENDEVIVFKDFFSAGLRFPLDAAVVAIFRRYRVYLHQMTPNSIL